MSNSSQRLWGLRVAESFLLAWRALLRGHVLTALLALTALAHLLLPAIVRSDGTAAGGRELFLRVVPGSVYMVLCVALLACACGLVARARESHRLSLAVVRPVSAGVIVLGPFLALVAVAAIVLAFNAGLTCARGGWTGSRHVYAPALEPPEVAARQMLQELLADTNTPQEVRSVPRHRLLAILVGRESDRYETIPPGGGIEWPFPAEAAAAPGGVVARIRFSTQFNLRSSLSGVVTFGQWSASVSNCTQSILEIPLAVATSCDPPGAVATSCDPPGAVATSCDPPEAGGPKLAFRNTGKSTVMLRPRRDVEILTPAGSFGMNMLRTSGEMLCVVAFLCAFGLFLSSALSRPVAIFSALVMLVVTEMAPAVVAQCPDALDMPMTDRIGLWISRAVVYATSAMAETEPISELATGTYVEWSRLGRAFLVDAVAAPLVLLAFAAFLVRRRASASRG